MAKVRTTGAARYFAEQWLGGPVRENETNPTVGVAVSKVVQSNPDRVGLVIVNQGAADIFVGLSNSVTTSSGVRLTANGGSMTLNVRDDFTLTAREWDGISGGVGNSVYVLEMISDITLAPEEA
jgi:hypothetical protein